jgi:MiaB/RimO family radical SAM methylthiotransferase
MCKKVCIGSLNSCIRRNLDANRLKTYFEINGYEFVQLPQEADYTFVFTCAFTDATADPNIREIEVLAKNPGELFVCGCLPAIDPNKLSKVFAGKTIITSELDKIDEFFPDHNVKFSQVKDTDTELMNYVFSERSKNVLVSLYNSNVKAGYEKILRISNGCLGTCSYCAIRKATGKLVSKPLAMCREEYTSLITKGAESIIIEAEDTGAYGIDINLTIADLFREIAEVNWHHDAYPRLFLENFHPIWITRYEKKLLPIFGLTNVKRVNCPIQSASRPILKKMNRYANTESMEKSLLAFRKNHPSVHINTHVIIGFPSEIEADVMTTVDFCKRIHFDSIDLYTYSNRDGTEASRMEGQIPAAVITERIKIAQKAFLNDDIDIIVHE